MSRLLTFASGWYNEEHGVLYCKAKGDYSNIYDTSTKEGTPSKCKLFLRDEQGGEIEVEQFKIVENTRRQTDKHPTHEVKLKLSE